MFAFNLKETNLAQETWLGTKSQ